MLTRVALPVKVVLGVAVAAEGQARLLARRAVGKGHVPVGNVVEEVKLRLVEQQAGGDGVDGGVAPAFVEEAAVAVEALEEVEVGLAAQPVEVAHLEVGPLRRRRRRSAWGSKVKDGQGRARVKGGQGRAGQGKRTKWHRL